MTEKTVVKEFGQLKVGDTIKGPNGENLAVVAANDEHIPETMYEVQSNDGATLKASGNHLWYIETNLDVSLHSNRRKTGARLFSRLPEKITESLIDVAEYSGEEEIETALIDMIELLECKNDAIAVNALIRIAESIGHISENSVKVQDMYTGKESTVKTIRHYDGKRFTQQILSLTGKRKFKKRWPLIVGRVVTTEDMLELSRIFDINIPESRNDFSNDK